ncbi:probable cellulose synthase A catalytic subunit 8 [UDP-forming] [Corylus avellana]|uniref:probable cellulose synthase A catalytic subunit 8 [UDP-forming] n=1 Tax=Corylus avellana TaxID=13451 RepID=UPI00286CA861|nr:probable cellulose synthase A catalytic subunit 8 [UDP-forming] [Corylus avellana]
MEDSVPLHVRHVHKLSIFINRSHSLIHSIAIAFLIYYRASFLFQDPKTRASPTLPWLLLFASELLLSFIWLLGQAYRWRPVTRTVFPERLPDDDKLPPIDVLICTADPDSEPTVEVMNTVLSAMALDYPPEKLHVYLSDDGGSPLTLHGMRQAWWFARGWLPFCRRYRIATSCPQAYFSAPEDDGGGGSSEFKTERQKIKERYEVFKDSIAKVRERGGTNDNGRITARDHPSVIEVIQDDHANDTVPPVDQAKMPLLVYVSREKRPSHPHHFKAGALNVLQRVSSLISNSPYMLVLDCDMYCNDPTSARRAMCFHLDSNISPSLAFVQFPQRFHNISKNDIYDSQLRSCFSVLWQGFDGLNGPVVSGTGFYIKRESLRRGVIQQDVNLEELKQSFGSSNELIKSFRQNHKPNVINSQDGLLKETQFLASVAYENDTKWGKEVGFLYDSVTEDLFTGFMLRCKGWTSVYCDPLRPQFLGSGITNLNDLLSQGTRWSSGLVEVGLSKFCPLIYGPPRISLLESMIYGDLTFFPLIYFFPLWCFATIPQLCLLDGITLYPKVSNPHFVIFVFIFLSAISKHLQEVLTTGGSFQSWRNEQRIWMIKSITTHLYGSLDAIMKRMGVREASFLPTNKVEDDERVKLYQMGKFDFQTSNMFLVPMVALIILNMASFTGGLFRVMFLGEWDKMFVQVFISFYILIMNFPIIEGVMIRKDKGRIQSSVTLLSAVFSCGILFLGFIFLL